MVWLNYSINNWQTYTVVDITQDQRYLFNETILKYGQLYQWKIGFNDSAGNIGVSSEFNFSVIDSYSPDVIQPATQSISSPEFNGTVITSIIVDEEMDASGIDTVWINFTSNNWNSFTVVNITSSQSYTFNETVLSYNQIYHWRIGFNDTSGNTGLSQEFSFTVIDSSPPDIESSPTQTTSNPEFNGTVIASNSR